MNLVIYHAHCLDGLTSAAIAFGALQTSGVVCLPMNYCKTDEEYCNKLNDVIAESGVVLGDTTLFLVDYSIPPSVLLGYCDLFYEIKIMDHHDSAIRRWDQAKDLPPNLSLIFKPKQSGAGITWEYFKDSLDTVVGYNDGVYEQLAKITTLVEDRDLWKFEHGDLTRNVCGALHLYLNDKPNEFLQRISNMSMETMASMGAAIRMYQNAIIAVMLHKAEDHVLIDKHGNKLALYTNIPVPLVSEFAEQLRVKLPEIQYVVIAHSTPGLDSDKIKVDFRGGNGVFKVNVLAEQFGGGGHPGSAGCYVESFDKLIDGIF